MCFHPHHNTTYFSIAYLFGKWSEGCLPVAEDPQIELLLPVLSMIRMIRSEYPTIWHLKCDVFYHFWLWLSFRISTKCGVAFMKVHVLGFNNKDKWLLAYALLRLYPFLHMLHNSFTTLPFSFLHAGKVSRLCNFLDQFLTSAQSHKLIHLLNDCSRFLWNISQWSRSQLDSFRRIFSGIILKVQVCVIIGQY